MKVLDFVHSRYQFSVLEDAQGHGSKSKYDDDASGERLECEREDKTNQNGGKE